MTWAHKVRFSTSLVTLAGMWKRLFFKRFRFRLHTYRFRFHQQKTRKRPLTIFLTFVGPQHAFSYTSSFWEDKNLHLLLLLYLLCLSLLFQTTLCLFFLDIRTRAECRVVLFNLFVIAEPLMYFHVFHGTPTNKNLEITNCLQENQIFRDCNSKDN